MKHPCKNEDCAPKPAKLNTVINYVASKGDVKGDVKAFFGLRLRFGRFSARVQMVFGSFCICSVLHRLGMCSVVPKIVLCGFQR